MTNTKLSAGKKLFVIISQWLFIGSMLFYTPPVQAAVGPCKVPAMNFDIQEKNIQAGAQVHAVGWIEVSGVDGGKCLATAGSATYASSIGISINNEQNGSIEYHFFEVPLNGTQTRYSFNIPFQLSAPAGTTKIVAYAKVAEKVGSSSLDWHQLTKTSSVTVQVAGATTPPGNTPPNQTPPGNTPPGSGGQTAKNDKLYNPLPTDGLVSMLLFLGKGFLGLLGVWAVVFIIISGFRMIMAQGDEEALKAAKKALTWAVLGLVVALLSFSIVAIVQNLLHADVDPQNIQNVGN